MAARGSVVHRWWRVRLGAEKNPDVEEQFCVFHADMLGQRDAGKRPFVVLAMLAYAWFWRGVSLHLWLGNWVAFGVGILVIPAAMERRSRAAYLMNRERYIFYGRAIAAISYNLMADLTAPEETKLQMFITRSFIPFSLSLVFRLKLYNALAFSIVDCCMIIGLGIYHSLAPGGVGSILDLDPDHLQYLLPMIGIAYFIPILVMYFQETLMRFRFRHRQEEIKRANDMMNNNLSALLQQVEDIREVYGIAGGDDEGGGNLRKRR
mmetsp:Transcript_62208/g.196867  ORF Transcript_62208/g.196867 Transcript_62208/m.196867 type:complete len:264 (-) Transcript_62208:97-888(-)